MAKIIIITNSSVDKSVNEVLLKDLLSKKSLEDYEVASLELGEGTADLKVIGDFRKQHKDNKTLEKVILLFDNLDHVEKDGMLDPINEVLERSLFFYGFTASWKCEFYDERKPERIAPDEVWVPRGYDVGDFFVWLPKNVSKINFHYNEEYTAYQTRTIRLPRKKYVEINGNGSKLRLFEGSKGFSVGDVPTQNHANLYTNNSYYIHDFAMIESGDIAVDLKATLGSKVERIECNGQSQAGVNLEFAMHCELDMVKVTHPKNMGIYVGIGKWEGGSATKSQSNKTILRNCRVYNSNPDAVSYVVDNSEGVIIEGCTSEGSSAKHHIFITATNDGVYDAQLETSYARNPVVKHCRISNFHIEGNMAQKGAIYVNMPVKSVTLLDQVYFNGSYGVPIVYAGYGLIKVQNMGWWSQHFSPRSRVEKPLIRFFDCHKDVEKEQWKFIYRMDGKTSPIDTSGIATSWEVW